jgi:lysophospholipase L1-like esterase
MTNLHRFAIGLLALNILLVSPVASCWRTIRAAEPASAKLPPFELKDGDRVVLIGSTFLEREQRYGYLETALTGHFPGRHVTFRNLAWSGDTVFGHARSYFDPPEQGFQRLLVNLETFKPTVAIIGYGWSESWGGGGAGLDDFLKGMTRLIDVLQEKQARVVIMTPPPHEAAAPPLPDPRGHNVELARYSDALRKLAKEKGCYAMDLFSALGAGNAKRDFPLTDNGIHPTAFGYWAIAPAANDALGLKRSFWLIDLDAMTGPTGVSDNPKIGDVKATPDKITFTVTERVLPEPPLPAQFPGDPAKLPAERNAADKIAAQHMICIHNLPPGKYALAIDGQKFRSAPEDGWERGVSFRVGPEVEQAEKLRQAIVRKNEFFFHRFRPANETYIFGFRKREQGQNAVEMPQFDSLIDEQEKLIDQLRVPQTHRYELTREN